MTGLCAGGLCLLPGKISESGEECSQCNGKVDVEGNGGDGAEKAADSRRGVIHCILVNMFLGF